MCETPTTITPAARQVVLLVALLNVGYFGIEFVVSQRIGAVALIADSVDFLEDASVNLIIYWAMFWSAQRRAHVGQLMAGLLLVPGLFSLWTAYEKFMHPIAPSTLPMMLTGAGALVINAYCAWRIAAVQSGQSSLMKAAFYSARNDALANVAIIIAGGVTAWVWTSAYPDLIVGLAIFGLNATAAWEVWNLARKEQIAANSHRA
jgi:Co/Zn/Cd efflux system component